MKISDIVHILEDEKEKRGDVEVVFQGWYGASSEVFEVQPDKYIPREHREKLHVWTDICTG